MCLFVARSDSARLVTLAARSSECALRIRWRLPTVLSAARKRLKVSERSLLKVSVKRLGCYFWRGMQGQKQSQNCLITILSLPEWIPESQPPLCHAPTGLCLSLGGIWLLLIFWLKWFGFPFWCCECAGIWCGLWSWWGLCCCGFCGFPGACMPPLGVAMLPSHIGICSILTMYDRFLF